MISSPCSFLLPPLLFSRCMLLDPPMIPSDPDATILTNSGKYAHYGKQRTTPHSTAPQNETKRTNTGMIFYGGWTKDVADSHTHKHKHVFVSFLFLFFCFVGWFENEQCTEPAGPGLTGRRFRLGTMKDCVGAAWTGTLPRKSHARDVPWRRTGRRSFSSAATGAFQKQRGMPLGPGRCGLVQRALKLLR